MASPQKENGFTPIANEILERLICANLNGTELSLVLFVIRKTYGFKKKEDDISLSQFMRFIPVSKPTICKALKTLQLVKVIKLVKKGNSHKTANRYSLNKDYDSWQLVKKSKLVKKTKRTSKDFDNELVKKTLHTKETIQKKLIQKIIPKGIEQSSYGNEDINRMLDKIKEVLFLEDFTETQKMQRIYGMHLVNLRNKLGKDEFGSRFMELAQDEFHLKNMGSLKYVYNRIKGFVPIKKDSSNVAFIS